MSLHGTLETFALPDVLALLAATKKSGELRVVGGSVDGRVWFTAGQVVATDVGSSTAFVDAVFDLLRLHTGKFSFDADREAPAPGDPVAIDVIVGEAQARLDEWRAIEAVVPSLAHAVNLVADIRDPHVMVTGEQWRALVAVASAPTVASVMERLGLGEFGTCKALKSLVEAGLVAIDEPSAAVEAAPAAVAAAAAPTPAEPPVAEAAEPAPVVAEPAPAVAEPAPDDAPAPAEVAAEAPEAEPVAAAPTPPTPIPAPVKEAPKTGKAKIAPMMSSPAAAAEALEAELAPVAKHAKPKTAKAAEGAADAEPVAVAKKEPVAEAPVEEAAAVVAETPAPAGPATEDGAQAEGDEPINRGLLLKFLSSVRT